MKQYLPTPNGPRRVRPGSFVGLFIRSSHGRRFVGRFSSYFGGFTSKLTCLAPSLALSSVIVYYLCQLSIHGASVTSVFDIAGTTVSVHHGQVRGGVYSGIESFR